MKRLRCLIRAVLSRAPAGFLEYLYAAILKLPLLRWMVNGLLCRMIPEILEVEGVRMILNPKDPVIGGALALGVYERTETQFLMRHVKKKMTVVDIGANIGYYTALCAAWVGPEGKVVAIEPEPESRVFLKRTLALNNFHNVEIITEALSDKKGTSRLYLCKENRGDNRLYEDRDSRERGSICVQTTTLDSLLQQLGVLNKVDLIKMDIQGAECLVLRGMKQTLSGNPAVVVVTEFWPQGIRNAGGDPVEFLNELREMGFQMYHLTGQAQNIERVRDFQRLIREFHGRRYTNLVCSKKELQ
ncbi:MAG: FkbM family methyltransferase [Candidatus Omnitrophica bacterium]|nr:FkbM family methyltransferase [Candidatus Omnitrophota bacterium]